MTRFESAPFHSARFSRQFSIEMCIHSPFGRSPGWQQRNFSPNSSKLSLNRSDHDRCARISVKANRRMRRTGVCASPEVDRERHFLSMLRAGVCVAPRSTRGSRIAHLLSAIVVAFAVALRICTFLILLPPPSVYFIPFACIHVLLSLFLSP